MTLRRIHNNIQSIKQQNNKTHIVMNNNHEYGEYDEE